jgi:hypothetical protein
MPSTKLPPNPATYINQPYSERFWHENFDVAYSRILAAEQNAMNQHEEDNTINARVVGYFILECFKRLSRFGPDAADRIVVEITSPPVLPGNTTHDVVYAVGADYRGFLLRGCESYSFHYVCRKLIILSSVRTTPTAPPTPASHCVSRPSMDTLDAEILSLLQATGTNYQSSRDKVSLFYWSSWPVLTNVQGICAGPIPLPSDKHFQLQQR